MDEVERIVHRVSDTVIVPSFGRLSATDITEKAPGELVTVVDRAAEEELRNRLTRLVPGSVLVGEESVGQDPAVQTRLGGDRPVWIVDPVDGTENFIAGRPQFSCLVALAYRSDLVASWLYAPLMGLAAMALAGNGATVNGRAVYVGTRNPRPPQLQVSLSRPRWWTPQTRTWNRQLRQAGAQLTSFDTAGLAYLDLMTVRHALVLEWQHVWDHAAGVLLLTEAGGAVCGADGRPFQLTGGNVLPMVAAISPATAQHVHHLLNPTNAIPPGPAAPRI